MVYGMKQKKIASFLIILFFAATMLVPLTRAEAFPECKKTLSLFALDVCNCLGGGMWSDSNAPFVLEYPAKVFYVEVLEDHGLFSSIFKYFLPLFQMDRPPNA